MFSNLLHPPHCSSQILSANEPCPKLGTSAVELLRCQSQHTDGPKTFTTCHAWNIIKPYEIPHHEKNIEKLQVSTCRIHQFYTSIILSTYHHSIPVPIHSCMFAVEFLLSGPPLPHAIHAVHPAPRWLRPDPAKSLANIYVELKIYKELRNEKQHNKNI